MGPGENPTDFRNRNVVFFPYANDSPDPHTHHTRKHVFAAGYVSSEAMGPSVRRAGFERGAEEKKSREGT